MKIDWSAFLVVAAVSLGATVVVAVLVSVALVEISARWAPAMTHLRHAVFASRAGGVVAAVCLAVAAAFVLFGLYQIVGGGTH